MAEFRCEKLACTLSERSCGKRWAIENGPNHRVDRGRDMRASVILHGSVWRGICKGCPVGELHSNGAEGVSEDVAKAAIALRESWDA